MMYSYISSVQIATHPSRRCILLSDKLSKIQRQRSRCQKLQTVMAFSGQNTPSTRSVSSMKIHTSSRRSSKMISNLDPVGSVPASVIPTIDAAAVLPHATEEEKAAAMGKQATFLLALRQPRNNAKLCEKDYEQLVRETKRVVKFYTDPRFPRRSLGLANSSGSGSGSGGEPIQLNGPLLCHSVLTTVTLPTICDGFNIVANAHIGSVIDMCLRTINSLRRSSFDDKRLRSEAAAAGKTRRSRRRKAIVIPMAHGDLAEEILRLLLSLRFYTRGEHLDDSKRGSRSRKLLHCYNSTLDVWAKVAHSQQEPKVAREAALRAERLLLDLTMSRNQSLAQHQVQHTYSDTHRNSVGQDIVDSQLLLSYISPDIISLNTVITAWSKCNPPPKEEPRKRSHHSDYDPSSTDSAERAENILTLTLDIYDPSLPKSSQIQPDRRSYDAVIQAWARCAHPDAPNRAEQLLDKMIDRYRSSGGRKSGAPFPTNHTFSSVLTAWANSTSTEATERAERLFQRMLTLEQKEQGLSNLEPDTVVFNSLLAVYAKQLIHLHHTLRHSSADQKRMAFNKWHEHCSRMEQILSEMSSLNEQRTIDLAQCRPDGSTHAIIMRAWAHLGKQISMVKPLNKGVDDFKTLHAYCPERAEHHLRAAIALDDEIHKHSGSRGNKYTGKNVTITTFNDLIQLYCSVSNLEKAEEIFHLAKAQHPSVAKVNAESFELLISAFSSYGRKIKGLDGLNHLEKAEELLMTLEESPAHIRLKSQHLMNMYNLLLNGMTKHAYNDNVVKRVDDLLMRMLRKRGEGDNHATAAARPTPNRYSFHAALSSYKRLLDHSPSFSKRQQCANRMEELVRIMEQTHLNSGPNVITYNFVLGAYAKVMRLANKEHEAELLIKKCEDLLQHMRETRFAQPDKFSFATVLNVIALSELKDAGDRALTFVEKVADSGEGEESDIDTAMFNTVLKAISQHDSDKKSAMKAEKILSQMENGHVQPDVFSYSTVMYAFSKLGTEEAVKTVENLYRRLTSRCQPDIIAFNCKIYAWSNIGTREAAQHAEGLLDDLLTQNESGDKFGPNEMSFKSILKAYLQLGEADAAEMAEGILLKLEDFSKGDTAMYFNWVLKKWGESRCHKHAERSLVLFEKMIDRKTELNIDKEESKQLLIGFNQVLNNFSKVIDENVTSKVEEIFRKTFMNIDHGFHLKPDDFSYSICMTTWARSGESIAPRKNEELLNEMIMAFEDGNVQLRPNTFFLNLVLKACSNAPIDKCHNVPFTVAIGVFGQMKGSDKWSREISHTTYCHMIAICQKHIANNDTKQSMVMAKILAQCCKDGHLSASVLRQFRQMPKQSFDRTLKALLAQMGQSNSTNTFRQLKDFPSEWRKNVPS